MKIWTRDQEDKQWQKRPNAFVALSAILDGHIHGDILLTSGRPVQDQDTLCAVLRIVKRQRPELHVFVGMPHPTAEIVGALRESRADSVWAVGLSHVDKFTGTELDPAERLIVGRSICPALHIHQGRRTDMSVCGKRKDRLVLTMEYFRKWCLAEYESCPYWRGEYGS